MSPPGRPKGEYRRAQHDGTPGSADDPLLIARLALGLLDRLATVNPAAGGRVVLVSSARAGEGKSFVAGLLHAALAAQLPGAEVTLCDTSDLAGRLFQPAAVGQAVRAMRERSRLTLIDGPTLAACGALAQAADAVLLVVDARRTPRRSITGALDAARLAPAQLAGVVLNRREAALPRWLGTD